MLRFVLTLFLLAGCLTAAAQPPSLDDVRRLLREDRLADALAAIEVRLAVDPKDRQTRFLKGVVLAEGSDPDAAIEVFIGLTRDYPTLPEPYNNLAVLYAAKGDFESARDALLNAINTHPSYATAHENLGDIYAKMAGLAYSRALSLDTANTVAKQKLALIDDLFTASAAEPVMVASRSAPPASPVPVPEPAPPAAAVTVARPAAAPAAVPPVAAGSTSSAAGAGREVVDALRSWAAAWSRQDVAAYLEHYMPGVSPEAGVSRDDWARKRRARVLRPAFIKVEVDSFRVRSDGESRMLVTFVQGYRSNTYADRVRKRVTLERTARGWMIIEEQTLAKL